MGDIVIRVEHVGKQYRLGEVGTGTLSHDLNRFFARVRGKEDPFAKIGEANDRTKKGESDYVWALRDINFDVKQGEVLGIIGRNGAGKSTLLKLLSKVTLPTTGRMKIKGRIASLLEVGTGFHPEMTGRENIFQNGAILGMTRAEIKSKLDEIVDFAGVERYIDTPVKRYSSGMYVRLAFAVAAFLEPEILIVDEVLAVGDAEFQKKCLGRMKDVSVNDGRTVLFVSHNMAAVQSLCTAGLFLKDGTLYQQGDLSKIISTYNSQSESLKEVKLFPNKDVWVSGFDVLADNSTDGHALTFEPNTFIVEVDSKVNLKNIYIGIGINDYTGSRIFTLFSRHISYTYTIHEGKNRFVCKVDKLALKPGIYIAEIYVGDGATIYDYYNHGLTFEVFPSENIDHQIIPDESQGSIIVEQSWT